MSNPKSVAERVAEYNRLIREAAALVADITDGDPAAAPQLVAVDDIEPNDYNPNKVAHPEMDLLEESIRADGVTMPIVVIKGEGHQFVVVDGFHRRTVVSERMGREYILCSVIQCERGDRMASTVRHNRARGKHQVDLMAALIRQMIALGWDNPRIAKAMGLSEEELLRLQQMTGVAKLLAGEDYTRSWGRTR